MKLFLAVAVGLVLLSSCGEDVVRDDSYDREQVQNCLNNGGTPIYEKNFDKWNKVTIVDFIACKNG